MIKYYKGITGMVFISYNEDTEVITCIQIYCSEDSDNEVDITFRHYPDDEFLYRVGVLKKATKTEWQEKVDLMITLIKLKSNKN